MKSEKTPLPTFRKASSGDFSRSASHFSTKISTFAKKNQITHLKIMKYGYIITISAILLLGSCDNIPKQVENMVSEHKKENAEKKEPTERKRNIIKQHINIPRDFSYITNLGSIDIIYTQGNFSVEVEGDSATLNFLKTDFDSNLLTVSIQNDGNKDYNFYGNTSNVKMYVSCPDLKCVSVCGNGSFKSQATWRTEDLQLGVLGSGSMNIENVECTTFSLQSSDIGNISIADLHAEDATIYSRSSAHIDLNVDVNNLMVLNYGTQTLTLSGKAKNTIIKNPRDKNLINNLQ